ncbi:hypothetical protein H8B06_09015 [Sphingobacterium sp. DN00404]|uniref:Uncharacterized protein n=1 Tax=Sphingobacterium micropteri TaxID=2763501 RepID=A0ABR7YNX0_9SPHI|nr:hypothetical protein [Sphingobacterium micropteri]MBD1432964.1 hypothetical protein [Sphingobacterium micropteri]
MSCRIDILFLGLSGHPEAVSFHTGTPNSRVEVVYFYPEVKYTSIALLFFHARPVILQPGYKLVTSRLMVSGRK